jgi:AcrR family transcriptional regulator
MIGEVAGQTHGDAFPLAPLAEELLDAIREGVARERPKHAIRVATRALVAYARSSPAHARLLMGDSLTGASRLRDTRDQLVEEAARIVEDAHGRLPSSAVLPDMPPRLICGVTCRLLAARLRRDGGEQRGELAGAADLAEEILGWVSSYELPVARHRWRSLPALPQPAGAPSPPVSALGALRALTRGRPRRAGGALAEDHRLRIVFATAEVIRRDGYAAASVVQIALAAGVSSRAFYRLFAGKREALLAADELLLRHAMAAAAGAFVTRETWPERVWEAARALVQCAEENPTLAYVALVESYAGGPTTIPGAEELARVFLQEGDRRPPRGRSAGATPRVSEVAHEAIGTAVLELGYLHARVGGETPVSALLAQIVFISLAPFLGAREASDFVSRQAPHGHARAPQASASD